MEEVKIKLTKKRNKSIDINKVANYNGYHIILTNKRKRRSGYIKRKGGVAVGQEVFITAKEVAELLGISKSKAYAIIRELNEELSAKGFITVAGRVSRKFFEEKFYGVAG